MKKMITLKKFIIMIVLAIIVVAIGLGYRHIHKHHKTTATKPTPILVQIAHVKRITIPNTTATEGTVNAIQDAVISAKVSGYIHSIAYHEGQIVNKGSVLITLDRDSQVDALASAKANALLSQLQYKRDQRLLKKGLILQNEYYQAKVSAEQNHAALITAVTNLKNRTIHAPFTGVVGAKIVSVGDYVNAGEKLLTLVDDQHLMVSYALPVFYLAHLKLGQTAWVSIEANPKQLFKAKVTYIAPMIAADSQSIVVHATLNKAPNWLKPGEIVNVTQQLGKNMHALVIPVQSVFARLSGYYVYTVKNHKAIKVPIKVGAKDNGHIIVVAGLKLNQPIIVAGQNRVKNNSLVTVASQKM